MKEAKQSEIANAAASGAEHVISVFGVSVQIRAAPLLHCQATQMPAMSAKRQTPPAQALKRNRAPVL